VVRTNIILYTFEDNVHDGADIHLCKCCHCAAAADAAVWRSLLSAREALPASIVLVASLAI
jgi:hypothetical protein